MAVMPPLSIDPTLSELQAWVKDMKAANNWTPTDFRHEFALLMEEVGELAKAHRKQRSDAYLTSGQQQNDDTVGEEITDVLVYLMSLANIEGTDIAKALQAKLEKNRNREWKKNSATA